MLGGSVTIFFLFVVNAIFRSSGDPATAMRSLWLGAPAGNNVWGAAAWAVAIIAIFAPLAVARYRRAAAG